MVGGSEWEVVGERVVGGRWEHNKLNNDNFIERDLGSIVQKEHNYFSQILSQCSKQGGRLGVTKQQGLLGLKTVSSNLSKNQVSV